MTEKKINRINELARKAKSSEGLSDDEKIEQQKLRKEYVDSYVSSLKNQLNNTYIVDEKGNKTKLRHKK